MLSVIPPPGSPLVSGFQSLGFKRSPNKKRMPHYSFLTPPPSLSCLSSCWGQMWKLAFNVCLKTLLVSKVELLGL